jgi:uncharacterized membrane protein
MTRSITLTTAALAIAFAAAAAAGPAQAASATSPEHQKDAKGVVVLIGANDYGVVAPTPTRAAD